MELTPGLSTDAPLNYLTAYSTKSAPVVALTWGLLAISVAVILIILLFVTWGIWRRGSFQTLAGMASLPIGETSAGLSWLYIGVGVSTVVLLATVVWTMWVLAKVDAAPSKPAFTIQITGHQWWWEAHYVGADPSRSFTTANELHIPTGSPVLIELTSTDVIHSFWVPPLSGKTDTIPGHTNVTWLDATQPGIYRGQCTEYCGVQHAKMGLLVVAQTPSDFSAWWSHQLTSPPPPASPAQETAMQTFVTRCGGCHTVRGTDAAGIAGPDLSHLMQRRTIAAGTLPNNRANLSAWMADPQAIKPGCYMPTLELTGRELTQIRSYLESLT